MKPLLFSLALLAAACATVPGSEETPVVAAAYQEIGGHEWPTIRKIAAGEPRDPLRRISAGGTDYGPCQGIILTVFLAPEPCTEAWAELPATVLLKKR